MTNRRRGWLPILMLLAMAVVSTSADPEIWTVQAIDPRGDGPSPSLDAAQLAFHYDARGDVLWFRVALYRAPGETSFDVRLAIDPDADGAGTALTASLTWRGGRYEGIIRVGDVVQDDLAGAPAVRVSGDAVAIGVRRTAVTKRMTMNVRASVGFDRDRRDAVPNARSVAIDLAAPRPARGLRELDVTRNNFRFPEGYQVLADDRPPSIAKQGSGEPALILIPGVYSGADVFAPLTTRHLSRFTCFLLVPPGLDGTPARALPPASASYGDFTWTRSLERDILNLISSARLHKPIIVTHGFPGSLAAEGLAMRHPELVGGIVELASMPLQAFPSMKDPTGRTPADPDERIAVVNDAWAAQWFKYVTPETWESNNYPAEMFANDQERGERARRQIEQAPLPVKIRYLAEFMASDHSRELATLTVPLLALRPGFNAALLQNPALGWFKTGFQDAWDTLRKSDTIQVTTIPDARARLLDDQPALTGAAILGFVERVAPGQGRR